MAGRLHYINQINDQLAWLLSQVQLAIRSNRPDRNVIAENILCGVMNRIHGWSLKNANAIKQNFAGVDLVDEDNCIAVQVTSTNSVDKVRHTLEEFDNDQMKREFEKLYILVMTIDLPTKGMKKQALKPWFDGETDIWNISTLMRQIEDIESVERLRQIADYLSEQMGLFSVKKHSLPGVPLPSSSFVPGSRDRELAELKEMLSPDAPIFLWGVGGIGKTEVAIQLARNFAQAEGAYFLHYYDMPGEGEALRETILRANFTDYTYNKPDTDNRDQEYKERMDILRTEYHGALLVIDNFDHRNKTLAELQAEKAYRELTAMGIHLVFTTRSQVRGGYEIKPLEADYLLELMRENLDGVDVSDDDLHRLIKAVDGHTLMVVLMARTLAKSYGNLKPSDILAALRESRMNSTSFRKVANEHNPANPQARIYDHMKALFQLSDMNDAEKDVLRWATLLPEDGMDAGLFQTCLGFDGLNEDTDEFLEETADHFLAYFQLEASGKESIKAQFRKMLEQVQEQSDERRDTMGFLIDRSWLAKGERNLLFIHPVIREVCRQELKPTDENCRTFLKMLWERYDLRSEFEADKFLQIAECFSMAADRLSDLQGICAYRAGRFWNLLGQHQTAMQYQLRVLEQRERRLSETDEELASIYHTVSWTFGELGQYDRALEYEEKALRIMEKIRPADDLSLTAYYSSMGMRYGDLGDYQKSLEYYLKDLRISKEVLSDDEPDLATAFNNVGIAYDCLGDYDRALEYKVKGLEVTKKALSENHPELATAYSNLGLTYNHLGNFGKALECDLKALAIRENVLPEGHPSIAHSYSNIGSTYENLGEYAKAMECKLKALAIREKILPPEHPDLATSYNNIGIAYANLEQFAKAAEYLEKAMEIRKKTLPESHLYIAQTEESLRYVQLMAKLQEAGISLDDLVKGEA